MKKTIIAVVCFVLAAMCLCAVVSAADMTNDTPDTATSVQIGTTYSGSLTEENRIDYYKLTLPTSGKVDITVNTTMANTFYCVYNANNEKIWGDSFSNGVKASLHLIAGEYYFYVGVHVAYGDYGFNIKHTSAEESFKESFGGDDNNSLTTANVLTFENEYKGQLAVNDRFDYYKLVLPTSGRIDIKVTTTMRHTYYHLYNASDVAIVTENTEKGYVKTLYLTAGTYYFYVGVHMDYGNYSFKITFKPSEESFEEDENVNNNSLESANALSFENEYKGQLAVNDGFDYYKLELPTAGRIDIKVTTTMRHTYYHLYNASGVALITEDTERGYAKTLHLVAGTYYFYVGVHADYGNFSFKVSFKSADESFIENDDLDNNSLENASLVEFGKDYKGQLALNDKVDYYKLVLPKSGLLTLNVNTTMNTTYYNMYNSSNAVVWMNYTPSGHARVEYLTAGTYYFYVGVHSDYGNYDLKATYTPTNESYPEEAGATDELTDSPIISIGTKVVGQLGINDIRDGYVLNISNPQTVTLVVETTMGSTHFNIFDLGLNHIWGQAFANGVTADVELGAGTYYFIAQVHEAYGSYSFRFVEPHVCNTSSEKVTPATCTENGRIDKICTICNKVSMTETLPAQHVFGEWVVDTPAVCNGSDGLRVRTCVACGHPENEAIPATEHQMDDDGVCRICGAKYTSTGGCSMVIAGPATTAMAISLLGAAVAVLKKKRED